MKKRILSIILAGVIALTTLPSIDILAQEVTDVMELEFITAPNEQERNRMWRADLEQFKEAVMQRHAKFWDRSVIFVPQDVMSASEVGTEVLWLDLERNERLRQGFISAMNSLIADVPNLTDAEIAIGMQSAVALLQDNHFNILPQVFFDIDPYLPLEFKHFGGTGGGFYLTRTTEEFAHVLNHRVTYINGIPMNIVAERFRGFVSVENIYNLRAELAGFLHSTLTLDVLELRENRETTFIFENRDGNAVEITLTEEHESLESIELIHGRAEGALPHFLQPQGINRFYFLEDYGVLYIRIEGYMPTVLMGAMEIAQDREVIDFDELEEEIREAIAEGLFQGIVVPPIGVSPEDWMSTEEGRFNWEIHPDLLEVIEQNDIRAAVIDARNNPGGDPAPFFNLFRFLGDNVDEGKLFYFANAGSASASILSAMGMHYMGATFVGEPLGQNTVFYGLTTSEIESGGIDRSLEVELNYTGFYIDIPNLLAHIEGANVGLTYLHLDFDTNAFLERTPNFEWYAFRPHVLIEHTIYHWINNIDPLLEYVIGQVSAAASEPISNVSIGETGRVTRGEFISMLIGRFSEDAGPHRHFFNTAADYNFADVEIGHPFYNALLIARGEGLIQGDSSGNFNPDGYISGLQAAVLLNNILGWNPELVAYNTRLDVPSWARGAVNVLLDLQMISPQLIIQETLTQEDAVTFIDAIERATLFLDSPYTLQQARPEDNLWMHLHRSFLANADVSEEVTSQSNAVMGPSFDSIWDWLLNTNHEIGSYYYRVVNFYNMLLDADNVLAGMETFDTLFSDLRAATNMDEFIEAAAQISPYFAIQSFFNMTIGTDTILGNSYWAADVMLFYMGLGDYEYYANEEYAEHHESFIQDIISILEIMGETQNLEQRAWDIFNLERHIYSQMSPREDAVWVQEAISWDDLHALAPNSRFFSHDQEKLYALEDKNVFIFSRMREWVSAVDSIYTYENLSTLVDIAKLSFMHSLFPWTYDEFVSLVNMHISGDYGSEGEIEELAKTIVRREFLSLFNQMYVDRYASDEVRAYVSEMAEAFRAIWSSRLDDVYWLSPETVAEARAKLYSMVFEISHPENGFSITIPDFYSIEQGGNFAYVIKNNARLQRENIIESLSMPVDISAAMWADMRPDLFNAMYHQTLNALVIPMGFLVYPNFDMNMPREFNMGAIGSTIAHEILHAFDDRGVEFDAHGIERNWWTDEDRASFDARTAAVADMISAFFWIDDYLDGNRFLTETIADLGSISVMLALAEQEGLDLREVMYANVRQWGIRGNLQRASRYLGGVHPPDAFRANFGLTMFDIFHEIFGIQSGDGMYVPREQRIVIW